MHPGHEQEDRPAAGAPSPPGRAAARPRRRRHVRRRRVVRRLGRRGRLALELGRRDGNDRPSPGRRRPDLHAVVPPDEGAAVRTVPVAEEAPVQPYRPPRRRPHVAHEGPPVYLRGSSVQDRHAQPPPVPAVRPSRPPSARERPPPYDGRRAGAVDHEGVPAGSARRVTPPDRRPVELGTGSGVRTALPVVEVDAVPAADRVGGGGGEESDAAAGDRAPPPLEGGRDREPSNPSSQEVPR